MSSVATVEAQTIQEAFQAAKAEHSPKASEPSAVEASTDAGDDAGTDEATTAPPAQATVTNEISDLISDSEYPDLQVKYKDNPDGLLKAAYTRATQALAKLSPHADFIADLENPLKRADALKAAAEQSGFTVAPKSVEATTTETVKETAVTLADDAIASFRTALGPDLDFLADKLAPAIQALAQNVAKATVGQAVEPLQSAQQTLLDKAAQEQQTALLESFTTKHPDWKQHETAITALGAKLQPNGMEPLEFLSTLYTLATKDIAAGETAKKAVARMVKAAGADEGKPTAVSGDRVAIARPANPTLREAFEAAKRGERWE